MDQLMRYKGISSLCFLKSINLMQKKKHFSSCVLIDLIWSILICSILLLMLLFYFWLFSIFKFSLFNILCSACFWPFFVFFLSSFSCCQLWSVVILSTLIFSNLVLTVLSLSFQVFNMISLWHFYYFSCYIDYFCVYILTFSPSTQWTLIALPFFHVQWTLIALPFFHVQWTLLALSFSLFNEYQ